MNDLLSCDNELESRIIKIGILNQYVYKNADIHLLIIKNSNSPVSIESNIKFTILNISDKAFLNINNFELLKVQVQTKQIENITIEPEKFKTVHAAYEAAKKEFADYVIFGNDVIDGIGTIEDTAGPPDRIFAYLETLKDFCIYKRNNNTHDEKADIEILHMLGCICTSESDKDNKDLSDQKIINDKEFDNRKFDNGSNQKDDFRIHLKPDTYGSNDPKKTVRIYFKWNEIQKKVIIGWIGRHLNLPPKVEELQKSPNISPENP